MSASTIDADAAVKKPRTKPAEIRREELMDAARDLFLEKGFAATSVDEIVRVADVAKGTFYVYFKTKDEVLEALKVRFIETFCRRVEEAVEKRAMDDWPGRLDAWVEAGVNGYLDQFRLHDLVFHEIRPSDRRMKYDMPPLALLADLLDRGVAAGSFLPLPDTRLAAVMLFYALHGAVDAHIAAPVMTREALLAGVRSFCRRAVMRA
jgi:AcrR family transcriptional regulator